MNKQPGIFTIGHSNHTIEVFLGLLRRHDIRGLVDVRSKPRVTEEGVEIFKG